MLRRLVLALLVTAVACSGGAGKKASTTTAPAAAMQLTSPAFADGGPIPRQYTCDGANQSPPLAWTGVPPGTASFALRVQDIDTPTKFVHWLAYNISPTTRSLAAGESPPESIQVANSFNKVGYGGPCPPAGATHRYVFTLLALQTTLHISDTQPHPTDLWSTLERSGVVGRGQLTGTYQRSAP